MARRLLLAVVALAAVLCFHRADLAVEGKEAPEECGVCEEVVKLHLTHARSNVKKVPAIGGIAENVCKQEADEDFQLVIQDEKRCCNASRTIIERAWLEVMKHDNDIVDFIKKKCSMQDLKEYVCKLRPGSAKGEDDDNQSKLVTWIKTVGKRIKNVAHNFPSFGQTEKDTNWAKACINLSASME